MAYADNYLGHDTPKLGFGMMRLPKLEDGSMDMEQICQMVDVFMGAGLTYFDTAYVYDGGDSEIATRKALVERYPRDSFTVTTKANAWLGNPTAEQTKDQLRISMERLGVDYLDYYLLHAIQDNNQQMYDDFGLWDWIRGLKEQGIIRRWGFSFHAGPERLERLLTEYPDIDFIQLQVNYADMEEPSVQARANYEVAAAHGVPFTVMEPVKGGTLANPPRVVREVFDAANPRRLVRQLGHPLRCQHAGRAHGAQRHVHARAGDRQRWLHERLQAAHRRRAGCRRPCAGGARQCAPVQVHGLPLLHRRLPHGHPHPRLLCCHEPQAHL